MPSELADRLAGLSPEQLALLSKRAREAKRAPGEGRIPPRPDRRTPPPLSFAQERLWFLDQIEADRGAYNLPHAVRLAGRLDVPALARALRAVVRRHEVLRTTYEEGDSGPVQRIGPPPRGLLSSVSLAGLCGEDRARESTRLATAEARRPFDLARGPVLRASLLRLAPEEHVLLLTLHHIAGDGWSMGILVRELAALYGGSTRGGPDQLPAPPIQYADFAVWQRRRLSGERLLGEIDFWRRRLGDPSAVLELPTDRPRPAVQTFRGAHLRTGLDPALRSRLEALARGSGATLFMVLLAAFQTLLQRYTGQDDLRVGTPLAGRTRVETEGLVGLFINTLVLRARLEGDPSFLELLDQVRETVLEAHAHQELPFEKLVEALQPQRDLAHPPLFQVMFNLEKGERRGTASELSGLDLRPVEQGFGIAKLDLTLALVDDGERLGGAVEYNVDLFDRTTVLRFERHYRALLQALAGAPAAHLSELGVLVPAERHQVAVEWPGPPPAPPRPAGGLVLHGAFAALSERRPDAVAAVCAGRTLTYGALADRARELARRLRELGVAAGVPVAVGLERGLDALVAVLGVLEAGGFYVPIDPDHPADRREIVLRDSGAQVLIDRRHVGNEGAEIAVRRLGEGAGPGAGVDRPPRRARGDELAYVIYTSGSTGRPKGVEVPHRAAAGFLASMARRPGLDAGDVLVAVTTLSFDISVLELFLPLSVGARVEIAEAGEARDPERLAARLAASRATVCQATPATWHMLLDAGWSPGRDLRILCGGEALSAPLAAALTRAGARVWNLYGPTETTVWSAVHRVVGSGGPVPIGRSVAGTRLRVLAPSMRPQPPGVPGELCIGGTGLARGYRGRPALTAERFTPEPGAGATAGPGERIYRTGDLVRWSPRGVLGFLGRIDTQVKVRGFRVELGEIEAVLASHPEVARAAVEVARRGGGDGRLAAFVVPVAGGAVDPDAVRAHAARTLPGYMVPPSVATLERLPLTPNGKVDRRALRSLASGVASRRGERVAPATPFEELVAEVWEEVLDASDLGATDDFFELGGHSLLATRVVARLRRRLGTEVPVLALFEAPTVAGLAARLEAGLRGDREGAPAPALEPAGPGAGPAPLSLPQRRLWLAEQRAPESPAYVMPFAVEVAGGVDAAALRGAVGHLVRRHETLRTRIVPAGDEAVQVVDAPRRLPLPVLDLAGLSSAAAGGEMRRLADAESGRPFDLGRGPLFRLALVRTPEGDVALGALHHVVSDAWSMEVLQREILTCYRAERAGSAPDLPELAIQYGDWARWQRARVRGETLDRQVRYWRRRLEGAPPALPLPVDRPRPRDGRAAEVPFRVPRIVAHDLAACSRQGGGTLFMTLLAAFQVLLARLSGEGDVVVGIPVSQRSRPELEGLIGFFVNTLAVRTTVSAEASFLDVLTAVRTAVLEAFAHQDIPFEQVLDELGLERVAREDPLVRVLFALQHRAPPGEDRPLGHHRPLAIGQSVAKVDWTLTLTETPEGLDGALEYRAARFDRTTARRTVRQLANVLEAVGVDPGRPVADLPLLGRPERHQLVGEWGRGPVSGRGRGSIAERVAEVAAERPDAVALEHGATSLTYRDVARRASALAGELQARGAGPERTVALFLDPSPEVVVGMLAVLWTGAAYVSVDPAYPEARIAAMLRDARPVAIVSGRGLVSRLPAEAPARVDPGAAGRATAVGSPVRMDPDGAAYVVYTSGSTGAPKGIVVPHRGVLRLVTDASYASLGPDATILQVSNLSFDAVVFEIWGALLTGARLVLPEDRDALLDPQRLEDLLHRRRIGALFLTTALFRQIARSRPGAFAGVGQVLFGGDAADPESVRRVLAGARPGRLANAYGPSECTTFATCHPVDGLASGAVAVPIGRPIQDTAVRVVDRELHPVAAGVSGELLLGGPGLARGYAGRPAATAEQFVPAPRGEIPGAREYRTGDLVRFLPDGSLEFVRRIDAQVKLRGFRVEPAEIETVLLGHPGVEEAVVLAARAGDGERHLVAFHAGPAPRPGASELRSFLRDRLPEFMVPAAWVGLDALPLTPNGKVDRRALERLEPEPAAEPVAPLAPSTPFAEVIAAVWAEVLGVDGVGAEADFLDLGGHSLTAARVAARLSAAFGTEVPLRTVFEHPVLEDLARAVEDRLRAEDGTGRPPLVPAPVEGGPGARTAPLSFAQRRFWFLDRLHPGDAASNIPAAVPLPGPVDAAALARALARLVRRHDVLRTRFEDRGGPEPVQVVDPPAPVPVPVIGLSGLPPVRRRAEARRLAVAEAFRPFDLARGPVLRALLLRLDDTPAGAEHTFLWTLHHIAGDGRSMEVLEEEIQTCYRAAGSGTEAELPELPIRYADFAAWQRAWLQGEALEAEVAWWRERLTGAPDLDLPSDRPPRALPSSRGGGEHLRLAVALGRDLVAFGRGEAATPFMVLLAAFQALLARLTGQDDVVVGVPVANRDRIETERIVGCFVNTLALRTHPVTTGSFRELVGRVREVALGAYAHQDLPFEVLVERLEPERDLARSPLFQVMFQLERRGGGGGEGAAAGDPAPVKFPWMLTVTEAPDGFRAMLQYRAERFDATTVRRTLDQLHVLLAGAMAAPDRPVPELPLLGPAQEHQLRLEWNDTERSWRRGDRLHDLVLRQAAATPDRVAVASRRWALSYGELERRAAALATALRRRGLGPEAVVGILLGRSAELPVALLAALRAGAAYVPLDPDSPRERLAAMAADAGCRLVLSVPALADRVPPGCEVLEVSSEPGTEAPGGAPVPDCESGAAAYVLFTSGSTGRPKGVVVPHRAIVHHMLWMDRRLPLGPADRLLHKTPLSFDASVWELYAPLLSGARLVMAEPGEHRDPPALARSVADLGVTVLQVTPSLLAPLLAEPGLAEGALRRLLCGGEVLAPELRDRALGLLRCPVVNLYGPCEATIHTSTRVYSRAGGPVTLGRGIDNVRTHVADARLRPVPPGISGELLVAGANLARGYAGRPAQTAERFIPDPWSPCAGGRTYRTGDLVRRSAEGEIESLGRLDRQVKVRGVRIELGEVESSLRACSGVVEAVVVPRRDAPGGPGLVAYAVVAPPGSDPSPPDELRLREALRRRLPEAMVPAAFVLLDRLPVSPAGKVDTEALPAPRTGPGAGGGDAPRDLLEHRLGRLWSELLGVERVGPEDSFFALGGHSLLAVRLVAEMDRRFGTRIPLSTVFERPTLEGLAAAVRGGGPGGSVLVELEPGRGGRPCFCVHAVGGGVVAYRDLAAALVRHLEPAPSVYGLQNIDDEPGAPETVEAMAERYIAEVRSVQPHGPYRLIGWSMGGAVAYEMACRLEAAGESVEVLMVVDGLAPGLLDADGDEVEDGAIVLELGRDLARQSALAPPDSDLASARGVDDALRRLLGWARGQGVLPPGVDGGVVETLFRTYRRNRRAWQAYRGGRSGGRVALASAESTVRAAGTGPALGWDRLGAEVSAETFPGDHYSILRVPAADAVARSFARALDGAAPEPEPTPYGCGGTGEVSSGSG